jgi:peptide/nickel transport system substrate-binding protein
MNGSVRSRMTRRQLLQTALLAGGSAYAGVLARPARVRGASAKTVNFALAATPITADPHYQQAGTDYHIYANVMDRLVTLDPATLAPRPSLAVSWRTVDDTTYEFKLRQGVKFHDGTPLDATAVKLNFERMLAVDTTTRSFTSRYKAVFAPDANTFVIKLTAPYAYAVFNLGFFQMSVISPSSFTKGREWLATHAVGTGPFMLTEWVNGQRMVLDRNPDYWGGAPKVDRVVVQVVPDENTRVAGLKAGDLDVIVDPPIPSVKGLLTDPGVTALKLPVARTYFIMYQLQDPVMSNLNVRQALAAAINRQDLVDYVTDDLNRLANNIIPPEARDGKATQPSVQIEYNPDKARALLKESNVDFSNKKLTIVPEMSISGARDTALAIQEDLRKVGIQTDVLFQENAQIQAHYKDGTYQLGPQSWLTADPDSALRRIFSSRSPWHYPQLQDPQFEAWLDQASTMVDTQRVALYEKIFNDLLTKAEYLPLYHKLEIVGVRRNVTGLRWSPLDVSLFQGVSLG